MRKHFTHSDDYNFNDKMKELLLGRKVVRVEKLDDQSAEITLDNGIVIETVGNEGCGGCSNGWYYLEELNDCNNAITSVECVTDSGEYDDDTYHIYVFAEDKKINLVQYEGGDNGYYGTGYDVFVKGVKECEQG